MNNSHLWLLLLAVVSLSVLFVFQHSNNSSAGTSATGARLRVREQTMRGHAGHARYQWDDDHTGTNDDDDVIVGEVDTTTTDWDLKRRAGSLSAQIANRRRQYQQTITNKKNDNQRRRRDDDETADGSFDEPVHNDDPLVSSSIESEFPAPSSVVVVELPSSPMPSLNDFGLETRVWPLPKQVKWPASGNGAVALISANVKLTTNVGSEVIDALWPLIFTSTDCKLRPSIQSMTATSDVAPTTDDCPQGENEGYQLHVGVDEVTLTAATQWGIINGLKTLAQLIQWKDHCAYIPNVPVDIIDVAHLPYRGFLVDSPRVFQEIQQLRAVIDRLAVLKLNVMHLRLTDDHSFVIESKRHPGLNKGQPHDKYYSQKEMSELIAYARARGVRIVPEIDLPGHATSWGKGDHPELVAKCPSLNWGLPLDPTIEVMWTILEDVLSEMMDLFIDPFFHLGGDEVNIKCFEHDRTLMERARAKGLGTGADILESFTSRFHGMLKTHPVFKKRTIILWEDLYENHKTTMNLFRKDIVFQTWISTKNGEEVAALGYRSLRSTYLYYNEIHDGRPYVYETVFKDLYTTDWFRLNFFQKKWQWQRDTQHLFSGAVSCMWEHGYSSYETKVWPLIPAVAERLWSAPSSNHDYDMNVVHQRLKHFQSYIDTLRLDERHATAGGSPIPVADFNSIRQAAGAKQGARDT